MGDEENGLRIGDVVVYKYNNNWLEGKVFSLDPEKQYFEVRHVEKREGEDKARVTSHRISADLDKWIRPKGTVPPPPKAAKPQIRHVPYYYTLIQNSVQLQPKLPKLFKKPFPEQIKFKKQFEKSPYKSENPEPVDYREFFFASSTSAPPPVERPVRPPPVRQARPPRRIGENFRGTRVERQYEVSNLPLASGIDPSLFFGEGLDPDQIVPVSSTALIPDSTSWDHVVSSDQQPAPYTNRQDSRNQRVPRQHSRPNNQVNNQNYQPNNRNNQVNNRVNNQTTQSSNQNQSRPRNKRKATQSDNNNGSANESGLSALDEHSSQKNDAVTEASYYSHSSLGLSTLESRHSFEGQETKSMHLESSEGVVDTYKCHDFSLSNQERAKLKSTIDGRTIDDEGGFLWLERNYNLDLNNGYTTKRFDLDITQDYLKAKKYSLDVAEEERNYDVVLDQNPRSAGYGIETSEEDDRRYDLVYNKVDNAGYGIEAPEENDRRYDVVYDNTNNTGYGVGFVDKDQKQAIVDWGGARYNDVLDVRVFVMDAGHNVQVVEINLEGGDESPTVDYGEQTTTDFFSSGNVFEDAVEAELKGNTSEKDEKEDKKAKKKEKRKKNKGKEKAGDDAVKANTTKKVEKNKKKNNQSQSSENQPTQDAGVTEQRTEKTTPDKPESTRKEAQLSNKQMKRRTKWDQRKDKRDAFSRTAKSKAKQ